MAQREYAFSKKFDLKDLNSSLPEDKRVEGIVVEDEIKNRLKQKQLGNMLCYLCGSRGEPCFTRVFDFKTEKEYLAAIHNTNNCTTVDSHQRKPEYRQFQIVRKTVDPIKTN